MKSVREALQECRERIAHSAKKSGKKPEEITLVAVSKLIAPERINEGIDAGIRIIGENRVQEARDKYDLIHPVEWHMVGHLQRNKVKHALKMFDLIQSVDSFRLAKEINKNCEKQERKIPVLIEVNTSGESSKYGCAPGEAIELVEKVSKLPRLQIKGLMTIGLFSDKLELVRPCFIRLRELAEKIRKIDMENVEMKILSMGMSADFELAIEEGSNMVRIGTAIFGPRSPENK